MAGIQTDKIRGLEILIYIEGTAVGGQRGASLSMSADELDVTDKNTTGYKKYLVGLKEWTISCDGLVVNGEDGYEALFNAFIAGEVVEVQFKHREGGFGYKGKMVIASMDFDAQYEDALTYSCELKGADDLEIITQ